MEPLLSRILIQHVQGADLAYLYNREAFDLLNIKRHQYDNSQFIEVGDEITYNNEKYVVKSINVKMFDQTIDMNHPYGVNIYSPTDPSNYNLQIGIFVDDADK